MNPHLAPWVGADSLVLLSGQMGFDANRAISATDVAGQTRQTLANIATVLADANLTVKDVVKTTVWLKDPADFLAFDAAYAVFFGEHRPARSTVIADLVLSAALVEIEAIACRPCARTADASDARG
jgi:2-iminobutanoate/2-iminopropanoate deaminase